MNALDKAIDNLVEYRVSCLSDDEIISIHHEAPKVEEWEIVDMLSTALQFSPVFDPNVEISLCQKIEYACWDGE